VFHGAGFTGSGRGLPQSRATVSLLPSGDIEVEAASTEIGQGTTSILASIVADALDVSYDWIRVSTPDTAKVPNSGPTVASRTCMIVGGLLKRSAEALRRALENEGISWPPTQAALKRAARKLCAGGRPFGFVQEYEPPRDIRWDDATYRGDAYGVYGYAAMVVELEIDKVTYEVTVKDVVTAQDVGRAINPLLVEGQITGGTAQALGYALLENVIFDKGVMANANFTNYVIPTTLDTPPMRVEIVERPYSLGPFGAKGVGELPMDVPLRGRGRVHQATGSSDRASSLPSVSRRRCMIELTVNRKKRRYRGPVQAAPRCSSRGLRAHGNEGRLRRRSAVPYRALDGEPVNSCLIPVAQAEGSRSDVERWGRRRLSRSSVVSRRGRSAYCTRECS
jgi:xanthine dehydrogenase molybdopterin-binding subunit B